MLLTTDVMENEAMSDWALGMILFIHIAESLLAVYILKISVMIQRQLLQSTTQLTKC